MNKKIAPIVILGLVLILFTGYAIGETASKSTFTIGSNMASICGQQTTMEVAPFIQDNRTYLPLVYVAKAIGIQDKDIFWNEANQTITLTKGDVTAIFTIGSKDATMKKLPVEIDAPPIIVNDRTCLPISIVGLAFFSDVKWDSSTQTVTIFSAPQAAIETIPTKQTITLSDGSTFTGMVLNGVPTGFGTKIQTDGIKLIGNFNGNNPNGETTIILSGGRSMVVNTVDGMPNGYAKLYDANGNYAGGGYLENGKIVDTPSSNTVSTPAVPPTSNAESISSIQTTAATQRQLAENDYQNAYNKANLAYQDERKSTAAYYAGLGAYDSSSCDNALTAIDNKYKSIFDNLLAIKNQTLAAIGLWEQSALARNK